MKAWVVHVNQAIPHRQCFLPNTVKVFQLGGEPGDFSAANAADIGRKSFQLIQCILYRLIFLSPVTAYVESYHFILPLKLGRLRMDRSHVHIVL